MRLRRVLARPVARTRRHLSPAYQRKAGEDRRSLYDLKLRIISHNLYGVDIDPFATNIAMLRLWLSLEVEADEALPLPNLDFKIETGDSLLGPDLGPGHDTFQEQQARVKADAVLAFKEQYLTAHGAMREEYRKKVEMLEKEMRELRDERVAPGAVYWRVQFAEAFANKRNGFDIVLANPPYVRQELIKKIKPQLKALYQCYTGVADLYVYFYERGVKLLRPGGQFAFISSNKWYRAGYGEKLRTWLAANTRLSRLIDFGDAPVFQAIAYPTIVLLERSAPPADAEFAGLTWQSGSAFDQVAEIARAQSFPIPQASLDKSGWRLEGTAKRKLLEKLRAAGTPLGDYCKGRFYWGIKTGLNDAFVVDRETRDRLVAQHSSSGDVLKPFLRGRDVKRWRVNSPDLWLIYVPWHFPLHLDASIMGPSRKAEVAFEERYPAIYAHLKQFKKDLSSRNAAETGVRYEWYALQRWGAEYWQGFEKPKVIVPAITDDVNYAPDLAGFFINNKASMCIPSSIEMVTSVCNSPVSMWVTTQTFASKQGAFFDFEPRYSSTIPIPAATPAKQSELEALVRRIVAAVAQNADVRELEAEVNERVYRLFGLTRDEIALMEGTA